ncbi:MAG: hypothetical protein CMH61_03110 [Nanoarchaeota archaeon]|nr:hypothetical protein [Nanoarchaeota archaeon]
MEGGRKMNEDIQELGRDFTERNEGRVITKVVSHEPEAVGELANLVARVVEINPEAFLSISNYRNSPSCGYERQHWTPIEVDLWSQPVNIAHEFAYGATHSKEHVARVLLQNRDGSQDSFVRSLENRNVKLEQGTTFMDSYFGRNSNTYALSVDWDKTEGDNSTIAQIVCQALREGIPLGEVEARPAKLPFIQYNAGQGRIGLNGRGPVFVLEQGNDIYVVPNGGTFCIDDKNHVTGAVEVQQYNCYDCDLDTVDFSRDLEKTLQGKDLTGKRVFFFASTGSIPGENYSCGSSTYNAKTMLEQKGAKVFATAGEMKDLL